MNRRETLVAGSKIAGLARIPRLVPKTWQSERSKLLKRCQTRLTASTKRPSVRGLHSRNPVARQRASRQDATGTGHENAKESPSDLDCEGLEREAMLSRVSKLGVAAVTSRLALPWTTQTQWSYLGFICGLVEQPVRVTKFVNGHWFKRVSGTTTGVMEATDPISTLANAGA